MGSQTDGLSTACVSRKVVVGKIMQSHDWFFLVEESRREAYMLTSSRLCKLLSERRCAFLARSNRRTFWRSNASRRFYKNLRVTGNHLKYQPQHGRFADFSSDL